MYDGTHAELWQATLTLFQDLGILPTFTDRDSGIIKAEVPYSDKNVSRKIAATVLLGVLAMPLWMDSGEGNRIFTAWVRELDESHVSVRLLGVSSKGDKLWSDKDSPVLHNTLRDTVQQQRFLKGTQTPLE